MQYNMHTVAFYRAQSIAYAHLGCEDIAIGAAQYAAWLEAECHD